MIVAFLLESEDVRRPACRSFYPFDGGDLRPPALRAAKSLKAEWWRGWKKKKKRKPHAGGSSAPLHRQETKKDEEGEEEESGKHQLFLKHLTAKTLRVSSDDDDDEGERETQLSYILCLLKFKPPKIQTLQFRFTPEDHDHQQHVTPAMSGGGLSYFLLNRGFNLIRKI